MLTDHEIFRRARRLRRARRYRQAAPSSATGALTDGDYVVHLDHGIGIYRGIETIIVGESTIEVAIVEYEGGDRLNVPLYRLDQLERYRAAGEDGDRPPPRIHRLGGSVLERVSASARARRSSRWRPSCSISTPAARSRAGYAFPPDTQWQRELESQLPLRGHARPAEGDRRGEDATWSGRVPMDRLLVGDVGYGKTEIAVRAAFKAVQGGKQVAVLVPTTILAEQHGRTFTERLADFPVQDRGALPLPDAPRSRRPRWRGSPTGKIDIVIGTHRLLSKDVRLQGPRPARRGRGAPLRREAQGAAQGAPARGRRADADRDADPPHAAPLARRAARPHADRDRRRATGRRSSPSSSRGTTALLEEAFARELDRGGQVFFVHNRIETIETIAARVRALAPRARVGVAHGQMPAEQLETVMRGFVAGEVDILVSTMIVESGLDVPNANTMVVHDAHRFGLAQLYQLRGRVGRSHRRAYCYLLVPDTIDADAEERLEVLEHHTDLGAGYRIALKDLEIRGAGNLLGAEQSGHAHAVGFDLYMRWLEETVRSAPGPGRDRAARAARRGARPAGPPAGRLRARRRRQARPVPPTGAGA